jgi:GINS complex subunit 2
LLLKKQQRANISPPPWLSAEGLNHILEFETDTLTADVFSPPPALPAPATAGLPDSSEYLASSGVEFSSPFLADSCTSRAQVDALPYHWLEVAHLLLTHAADDFDEPEVVRRLLRDLREVRMSKLRKGFKVLDAGAGVKLNGVGGMEIAEVRGFVTGMVDGLRYV